MNKSKVSNVKLYNELGNEISTSLYFVDHGIGRIQFDNSLLNDTVYLTFNYKPIYQSGYLNNEDAMQVFDGMKIYVKDDILERDVRKSGWINSNTTITPSITKDQIQFMIIIINWCGMKVISVKIRLLISMHLLRSMI